MLRMVALAVLLLSAAPAAQAGDILRIGLNDTGSYPYIASPGATLADPPGLSVELLQEVGRRLDIQVRFVRMPGLRVLAELQGDALDGALLFSHTREREAQGAFPMRDGVPDATRRLATLSYALYTLRGSPLGWAGGRLVNLRGRIAAKLNYSIVQDLRDMGIDVAEVRTTADSFRMLQAGRIDGVADHAAVADAFLSAAGITGVDKLSPPLADKAYYLMLSHRYAAARPDRAQAIWNLIGELRDSITRERLPAYPDRR